MRAKFGASFEFFSHKHRAMNDIMTNFYEIIREKCKLTILRTDRK